MTYELPEPSQFAPQMITEDAYTAMQMREAFEAGRYGESECDAWRDVIDERRRQITAEGWSPIHDDEHCNGEIARAAATYALYELGVPGSLRLQLDHGMQPLWPWDWDWLKPKGPRRNLVRAAALLLAEIERIDRKSAAEAKCQNIEKS